MQVDQLFVSCWSAAESTTMPAKNSSSSSSCSGSSRVHSLPMTEQWNLSPARNPRDRERGILNLYCVAVFLFIFFLACRMVTQYVSSLEDEKKEKSDNIGPLWFGCKERYATAFLRMKSPMLLSSDGLYLFLKVGWRIFCFLSSCSIT